ncbi:MAG: trigger factor, partial [Chloroflexota bacterium]
MKIETQIRDDHQAELTVEVELERLEALKTKAAAKIARKIKVPGFRPGKAPYTVVLRQVGEAAVIEEAIELLVDEIYPEVIKEANIQPYGPGNLEAIPSMDPLTFKFIIPLEATVEMGDYQAIRKPYEPKEITDQDVDNVIQDLRDRQAIVEPVERPAQVGDQVTI